MSKSLSDVIQNTKDIPQSYVYQCVHKITGEFYIGYRFKNVQRNIVAHLDLPIYRTSSKIVNPKFDEFNWAILAEFSDKFEAYDFEQKLIHTNWDNPLLLNKQCHYGKKRWNYDRTGQKDSIATRTKKSAARIGKNNPMYGTIRRGEDATFFGKQHSEHSKQKISIAKTGKKLSELTKEHMREAAKLKALPSQEVINKRADANRGGIRTATTRQNISNKAKLRSRIACTHCGIVAAPSNLKRWHNDNCKYKIIPN